ncbi:MAG: phosphoribosylaminoimidazolesuccinocarboxamide synthase [Patescibacteria group bacterium]
MNVDAATADRQTAKYRLGRMLTEGKTKKLHEAKDKPGIVIVISKDDITAGDGKKHDIIVGKANLATETTCNVFELLKACDIPIAYIERDNVNSFIAYHTDMLPYEVVVRREAHGSYLKSYPHLQKGHLFQKLVVQFFLKTKDRRWKEHTLVCDDPLMLHREGAGKIELYNPAESLRGQKPFLILDEMEVFGYAEEWHCFKEMQSIATKTFLVLERAWELEGGKLVDFKVEFGFDPTGNLVLSDVIDNDSWRVVEDGAYLDKQVYRDGGDIKEVANKYERVANITSRFRLPSQRIILWCGSESDVTKPFHDALGGFRDLLTEVVCSAHKEPQAAVSIIQSTVHAYPNSVVIAYIGRSNGAGPILSAQSTVPVITVPASVKDFPDDVWSSLRAPSKVPVMTVLEPTNAVLATLQILSARNPRIYAHLRQEVETRLINTIPL